ncbi:MAG TPA: alanine--glyoxylate aminotransferase family protein [Bacillota bacterium]|nr:alanine--glyoxylate aminotransferase family protein [Bacillota bacterium]HOL12145.1 alanine--glyoxylate aminotransferase family protein [Bacillota bacterium]HOQ03259.1 alanine--glyoxylate aminotransferase family protein [Bacillota bacterium]HPP60940.1 alanine--glyoxylate aminotransferase family protein [Bacillota bacterium]HPV13654.1 alanine--glyoxylate aminotransferase family protein [Bacillota bacterium]
MNLRNPKSKLLLGPGPSNADPRVLRALSEPTIGHLDPDFVKIMDETTDLLRYVFQTANQLTIPISGTGSAGMETAIVNSIEPGDKAIICVAGVFGERMVDVAERSGAVVVRVDGPWGSIVDPEDVRKAIKENPDAKIIGIVHAETSTGVLQPLEDIASMAHENGMRIVVDAVTSLGGVKVPVDELELDFVYSGTQKCLSCPPGLAPVTVGPRALDFIKNRETKCQSWYLDLAMISRYWGSERFYHHTAPVNMIYALNEALRIIKEEGLESRWARHQLNQQALITGLEAMGMKLVVEPDYRLPSLTTVYLPDDADDVLVRSRLLKEYDIEIGAALGEFKGRVWRIGLMGTNSTKGNVLTFLAALEDVLTSVGAKINPGVGLQAASAVYR